MDRWPNSHPRGYHVQHKASEFKDSREAESRNPSCPQSYYMVQKDGVSTMRKINVQILLPIFLIPQRHAKQKRRNHGDREIDDLEVLRPWSKEVVQP